MPYTNKKFCELNIQGIKCDYCEWRDMSVPEMDYEEWIDKPCPECGSNLLTQLDYDKVMEMRAYTDILNDVEMRQKLAEATGQDLSDEALNLQDGPMDVSVAVSLVNGALGFGKPKPINRP